MPIESRYSGIVRTACCGTLPAGEADGTYNFIELRILVSMDTGSAHCAGVQRGEDPNSQAKPVVNDPHSLFYDFVHSRRFQKVISDSAVVA
jgi:hypothetical protein